jgi:uncharacterized protein YydD (DUF2326 family)
MMRLKRLYTLPEIIDPIEFSDGFNLILGEKSEFSDKTNGVGKSLCIEFINFALLKKKSDSRVALIPQNIFPLDTCICLDFELNEQDYTIKRSLEKSEEPIIIENGNITHFTKIEDATKYFTERLFFSSVIEHPSFRAMLGPLIRDERSEFKSLVSCYDTKNRIPDDYSPHLYLLGIEIEFYEKIKKQLKDIDNISKDIIRINENVKLIRQKDIDDARSDLNELDDEVHSIEFSINKLENLKGYEIIKDDVLSIEEEIETLRRKKTILKQELSKLKLVTQNVNIDTNEISEFYEQLKVGLGDLISKNLKEVIAFKTRIDNFQNKLINDKRERISTEISSIDKGLAALDKQYTENLAILDQKGGLKNLKQTYAAFKEKSDQLSQLKSFIDRYDELMAEKQRIRSEKENHLLTLQSQILMQKNVTDSFEKTILNIHEYIQGNKNASFKIMNTSRKQVVEISMRIDDDGSHSVEREKVFIYDMALLLNQYTKQNHPGFLIHDNIFDVDQDTLMKSIEYIENKADFEGGQYILTLNSDRLELNGEDLLDNLEIYIKARFTKNNRFLKIRYQETH